MTIYSQSEASFWIKTIELITFQQIATIVIYLSCFGWDLIRDRNG
jgi:hypothetical protein